MSIDNWPAVIGDIRRQLNNLEDHVALDLHEFNKAIGEARAAVNS